MIFTIRRAFLLMLLLFYTIYYFLTHRLHMFSTIIVVCVFLVLHQFAHDTYWFFYYLLIFIFPRTFSCGRFLKRVSTKSGGSSTTTTNAEVMLIEPNTCEVINHVQLTLFHVWGHKKVLRKLIVLQSTLNSFFLLFYDNKRW